MDINLPKIKLPIKLKKISIPFRIFPKSSLGIDVGVSSVKVAEIARVGARLKLENYGEIKAPSLYESAFRTFEKSTLLLSSSDVAKAIRAIGEESKIKTKIAVFSLPDFLTFFTTFELPPMSKEELPQAIRFEARQHIPLPLGEVTIDWQIVRGKIGRNRGEKLRILLVAVPNEIIYQYQEIAVMAGIQLRSLEAEAFGLVRSLVQENPKPLMILDLGVQSTTINLVDDKTLQASHSFDVSGNELTRVLAKSLSIDYKEAEDIKIREGIKFPDRKEAKALFPLIDIIIEETGKIASNFREIEGRTIEEIILAGGSASLPGLKEYFAEKLKKNVRLANPFTPLYYPSILEKALEEIGPSFAVAVGMAERELM